MPVIKGLEWTFDTVASDYERLRPGYTKEVYREIFDYVSINRCSNVLEIGIGGGQATLPVLRTGCKLTAVEYGESFSALCRKKFSNFPNFSVITGKFEDTELEAEKYSLIYSASAFHWIPEEVGYNKVYSLLRSGGVFARFANHPFRDKGRPELSDEIQKLYAVYMNSAAPPKEYGAEDAEKTAGIAYKYGFQDIKYKLFYRTRSYSADDYTALLGTYSDHIALGEKIRTEFFSKIRDLIISYGGKITVYDTIDLQLARKP